MRRGGQNSGERQRLPDEPGRLLLYFADLISYGRGCLARRLARRLTFTAGLRKLVIDVDGLHGYDFDQLHSVTPLSNQDLSLIISIVNTDKSRG